MNKVESNLLKCQIPLVQLIKYHDFLRQEILFELSGNELAKLKITNNISGNFADKYIEDTLNFSLTTTIKVQVITTKTTTILSEVKEINTPFNINILISSTLNKLIGTSIDFKIQILLYDYPITSSDKVRNFLTDEFDLRNIEDYNRRLKNILECYNLKII